MFPQICDTKQMGRGEGYLCNHVTFPTDRKALEYTRAFLKHRVFPGKRTYAPIKKKPKTLETKHVSKHKKPCIHRQTLPSSDDYEVVRKERQQRSHHVCYLLPDFGDFRFLASLMTSVIAITLVGYKS